MSVGLLEQVKTNDVKFLRRAAVRGRWYQPILAPAALPLGSLTEAYSVILPHPEIAIHSPVRSPVRTPIHGLTSGGGGGGINYLGNTTLTTTAGVDATPTGSNQITIPAGCDALSVYTGDLDHSYGYVSLVVRINSTDTALITVRESFHVIPCAAGDIVSFASQKKIGENAAATDQSITLSVCPMLKPASLVTPSVVSGTANCDKSGSPVWVPSGTAHVIQTAEGLTFKFVAASGRREFFMREIDGNGALTPVRHIHVPDNTAVTVLMRHRQAYLANYAGATASITGPSGCQIGGTSTAYRPSFTAVRTVNVTTPAELASALTTGTVAEGDDIVLAAGTYTLSNSNHYLTNTNFGGSSSSAMGKNIRIRGATGTALDVVITGSTSRIIMYSTNAWIIESIRFNMSGLTIQGGGRGVVDYDGNGYFHNCDIIGPGAGTAANLALRSSTGSNVAYVTYCLVQNSIDDGINTDQGAGSTHVCHVVAGTCDGNGNNGSAPANKQILTNHHGAKLCVWGTILTDATQTANQLYVTADADTSPLYLFYCRCLSSDVTHADGLQFTGFVHGVFFCDFGAIKAASLLAYAVGSRLIQRTSAAGKFVQFNNLSWYPSYLGNFIQATGAFASSCDAIETRSGCELLGNYIESQQGSYAMNFAAANPASARSVNALGNTIKCASGGFMAVFTATANMGGALLNNIFDAGTAQGPISVTNPGGDFFLAGNYFRRSNTPTNWDARFTSDAWSGLTGGSNGNGNNASTSAPGLGADFIPTAGGNCDNEGVDAGFVGAIDFYGRPLYLGSTFHRGGAEIQEIRGGAFLFPGQW